MFIFSRIKKGKDEGNERCHSKTMMNNEVNESLRIYTQHVPLSQNTQEKVQGKEVKPEWGDVNE